MGWLVGAAPDGDDLGLQAPRGWSFVRTGHGEGRFHDPDGHDLLSLRAVTTRGTPESLMRAQIGALAGTPGLDVVGQHVRVGGGIGQRWATLAYRWRDMGEPRIVKVRWIAFGTDRADDAALVLTVAGRALDGPGLDAVLAHASPTVELAG